MLLFQKVNNYFRMNCTLNTVRSSLAFRSSFIVFLILIIILASSSNLINLNSASSIKTEHERQAGDTLTFLRTYGKIVVPISTSVDRHKVQPLNNGTNYQSKMFSNSDTGFEARNRNNWITVNHDIHSTRFSNQTTINKDTNYQSKMFSNSDTGFEARNRNNWITVNHDIHSTRFSNQTTINKENVAQLKVK